jgi:hypothetical protein
MVVAVHSYIPLRGNRRAPRTSFAERYAAPMDPVLRADIERWFVRRGVPQLIEDYTSEARLDARAGPLIAAWIVAGATLWWGTRADGTPEANALGILAVVASVLTGTTLLRIVLGRGVWRPGARVGAPEVFAIGPLVGIPAGIIDGSMREAVVATLNSLLGVGAIYVVVALGVIEIGVWSIGRLGGELRGIVDLLARTLPVLLVLVLFLLFAAELWEAAALLSGMELVAVLALLLVVATVLVLSTVWRELSQLDRAAWDEHRALAVDTPAAPLAHVASNDAPPRLRWAHRLNLSVLGVLGQLIQSAFVAALVTVFLVAFGLLVLPAELQARWIGEPIMGVTAFGFLGEERVLSWELIRVAVLLGGVVGLYFTGLAVTDAAYRASHFDRVLAEIRALVAARALYAAVAAVSRP